MIARSRVNRHYDQEVKNVFERLVAKDLPDHEKAGYSEAHFAARARDLRRDFDNLRRLLRERENPLRPLKVLDVGCNNGALTARVLPPDLDRYGVDCVPGLIEEAAAAYPQIKFSVGDCYELPFGDRTFDMVVSFGLLQVLSDCQRCVGELVRVTKPGGIGLVEFLPGDLLPNLIPRVFACLARRKWSEGRRLIERHLSGAVWSGLPLLQYRYGDVLAALHRCRVSRTMNLSRRCLFFNSHRGVVAFVR